MTEAAERGAGGTQWDAPNQQVVRDDASAPWEEGTGGEATPPGEERDTPQPRGKKADADEPDADEAEPDE